MRSLQRLSIFLLIATSPFSCLHYKTPALPGSRQPQFTDDGAWCWFSDPRAIYYHTASGTQVISGWVKADGTIEAGALNLASRTVQTATLQDTLEKDDHDNPAFVQLADGSILAHYTKHGTGKYYQNKTNTAGQVKSFSPTDTIDMIDPAEYTRYPKKTITYGNPVRLAAEHNRLYSFGRWTGYKPNIMWSNDNGKNWSTAKVMITNPGPFNPDNRPYVKYFSDGQSRIHIVFTDGHPRNEPTNSVYYAYYENGNFYKADGTKICAIDALPFVPGQASVVYQATEKLGKAWVFDIAATESGNPVIAYTRYPTDQDHRYHYAVFDGKTWVDHEICASGKWFPKTPAGKKEPEPNYSGGLALHPTKSNTVYLSRSINGVFEIEKRVTQDNGASWKIYPITQKSIFDNVRPYVPRNYKKGDKDVVCWMQNVQYIHYLNFKSNIRYYIEE
ncbi:MAG: BNR-4 repeat-containing protein [Lewinellaceae bacterium]|nr:BNR-4 repeat-containing protein [Saprospiraceae bacterium]MCB9330838.1 BNR-4 repeat-containing protein [Lewinellaceae bacterium]